MIPKITLKELWKITMRRSSLITIPNLIDFFDFSNEFTKWEVFYGIVRDALDKFQYYYPLYRQQKTYLTVDSATHRAQVSDNFEAYLKDIITEDQIFLLPGAVIGLAANSMIGSTYPLRDFHYETGEFSDFWYTSGNWWMACLCNYPFPEIYDEAKNPTDQCAVYWMFKDGDVRFKVFKDEVYCCLCQYIWNMKQNMQLQNLPIDVFAGLQEDSQRVRGELEKVYDQALTASGWVM